MRHVSGVCVIQKVFFDDEALDSEFRIFFIHLRGQFVQQFLAHLSEFGAFIEFQLPGLLADDGGHDVQPEQFAAQFGRVGHAFVFGEGFCVVFDDAAVDVFAIDGGERGGR